jgi:putative membrane protein
MKRNNFHFAEPTRQSPIAIVIILLKFFRRTVGQFWPIVLLLFVGSRDKSVIYLAGFGIFITLTSLFRSLVDYYKFIFYIKDDELIIERGFFQKSKVSIPFDRIQSINFEQSVIHQFFKVIGLHIDTAGTAQKELDISALESDKAEALRRMILDYNASKIKAQENEIYSPLVEEKDLILQLNPEDLIKIGVSQNHLRTAGIIMAFFFGFLEEVETIIQQNLYGLIADSIQNMVIGSVFLVLAGAVAFIFVSFIITLFRTVLNYYNFKLWKIKDGFTIVSGLFNRKESTARKKKVQLLTWSSTLIQRLFGLYKLGIYQASTIDLSLKNTIRIPGAYDYNIRQVVKFLFPKSHMEPRVKYEVSNLLRWRYFVFAGILPAVAIVVLRLNNWMPYSVAAVAWLVYIFWWSGRYIKTWEIFVNDEYIKLSYGVLTRRNKLVRTFKIQAVETTQSIYQRRHNLANLILYTASGDMRIPYISVEKAHELMNYVLYKIERDNRKWM